jgi:HK97 family phage major capsid protein
MKRLHEIEARKLEIRDMLSSDAEIDMESIDTELRALETEKSEIEKRQALAGQINIGQVEATPIIKPQVEERGVEKMEREQLLSSQEYRTAFFKNLQGKPMSEVEQRALTTAAVSAGSAVPTQTLNQIIDKLRQTSALYNYITVSFVPGNLSFVVANAKNVANWKTEGSAGTAADDTVVSVTLGGYEIIKLVEISAAATAMTIDAFESYISAEIGRQLSIAFENAIVNGDGSGEPTGILTGITWGAANSTDFTGVVDLYDTLMDALGLLPTMYHQSSVFVLNRKTLFGGIRKVKATDGQPIFAYNPQDRAAMTILGYGIVLNDYVPDDVILLGDFSYYRLNFSQAPTIEASREAGFTSGKTVYRGLAVADGKPALAEAFVKIVKA